MTARPSKARSVLGVLAWILVLTVAWTASPATAESVALPAAERAAIRRVIEGQLEAFKRHDAKAAFAHAAPAIQALFGSPESFMLMVRTEYPPIYQPRSFTFGELELVGGEFTQKVTVVGEDGSAVSAFYLMSRQKDDSWRVLGCILVPVAKTII